MKIQQIRNATVLLDYGDQKILVDPMLAKKGKIPSLKYLTKKRIKNPLVDLPMQIDSILESVTHVLITHCQKGHFDHLDRTALRWIRDRQIPVLCTLQDKEFLMKQRLEVQALSSKHENSVLGLEISLIPCVHGKGLVGSLMSHGFGYILKSPHHPSVYIVGDTIRTKEVEKALILHRPDIVIMPGGGAKFDFGNEIIMGIDDIIPMAKSFSGTLIVNHLEALDHCPVTREQVQQVANEHGLSNRIQVPLDGEELTFTKPLGDHFF